MGATLTIDRTNLSLTDLVIGTDTTTGYTLDPGLKLGDVTWRKHTEESENVAGRQLIDYVRDSTEVRGSITVHGMSETDLQTKMGALITALTRVDDTLGFQAFPMTYTHGAAVYQWTCTEPGDLTIGSSTDQLDDMEMASFLQSVGFVIVRDPIPLAGPI